VTSRLGASRYTAGVTTARYNDRVAPCPAVSRGAEPEPPSGARGWHENREAVRLAQSTTCRRHHSILRSASSRAAVASSVFCRSAAMDRRPCQVRVVTLMRGSWVPAHMPGIVRFVEYEEQVPRVRIVTAGRVSLGRSVTIACPRCQSGLRQCSVLLVDGTAVREALDSDRSRADASRKGGRMALNGLIVERTCTNQSQT
jgi:hypothetical protein